MTEQKGILLQTESPRNYYHWWEEPEQTERRISCEALRRLLGNQLRTFGVRNLRELFVGKLGLERKDYARYWRVATGRQRSIRTANLVRMCDGLGISYSQIESRKVLVDRPWPINLRRPELTMLESHILNEGTVNVAVVKSLYRPTGIFSFSKRTQAQYYNNDPVLHGYVRSLARKCGATSCRTVRSRIGYTTILDGTTSRLLLRVGMPPGRRSEQRFCLAPIATSDQTLWRHHFCSTLIEEGYCSLRLSPWRRLVMEVGYYRGIDITEVIPSLAVRRLARGARTVIGKLPGKIIQVVKENPPLLMVQEVNHLGKIHSQVAGPNVWPQPQPYEVRKCLRGNRVIANWRFTTSRSDLLDILSSYFNFPIPSWKRKCMQERYKIFREFRARQLSPADWTRVKKRIDRYSSRMPSRWLGSPQIKLPELMP